MVSALPPDGLIFPDRIYWNEPGTDEDTIDYMRFQRFFGVDGALDDDVGDQRLNNETELERQHNRTEAQHNASIAELVKAAESAAVGGVLSESERRAMELPWVQDIMRDAQVKAALDLLAANEEAFQKEVDRSPRLRSKIGELVCAGAVAHPAAAVASGEASCSARSA